MRTLAASTLTLVALCLGACATSNPHGRNASVASPQVGMHQGNARLSILTNDTDYEPETSDVYIARIREQAARTDRLLRRDVADGDLPQEALFEGNARRQQLERMLTVALQSDGAIDRHERREIRRLVRDYENVADRWREAGRRGVGGGPASHRH